jgi:hypothetical protein
MSLLCNQVFSHLAANSVAWKQAMGLSYLVIILKWNWLLVFTFLSPVDTYGAAFVFLFMLMMVLLYQIDLLWMKTLCPFSAR